LFVCVLAALGSLALASDSRCTSSGGHCQTNTIHCAGSYASGLCDGASSRQCCQSGDSACTNTGGHCQTDTLSCSGTYLSGLCSGASNRRCCQPSSGTGTHTSSGSYTCYGDFMKLHPTGASAITARQDGISSGGPAASHRMVTNDYTALNNLKNCYVQAGNNNCVHPAVIAGIASRETRGGTLIQSTGGWGDHHHAYGIMQCDGGASGLGSQCTQYPWNSCEHIDFMTREFIVKYVGIIKHKHPSWAPEVQLQGAVSAYNAGTGNVATISGMDRGTTHDDYSNDVMARAQYLVTHYHW